MLSEQIKDLLEEYNSLTSNDDWIEVNKYILKSINPIDRKLFSKRDITTKKHTLNQYENEIIKFYKSKYNIDLEIPEDKKHKLKIWQRKKNQR